MDTMTARRPDADCQPPERAHQDADASQLSRVDESDTVMYPVDAEPPEIAPPLLLEPIPAPTLTGMQAIKLDEAPEPIPDDPYSWAAEAASSMERSGQSFDVFDEIDQLPGPPDAPPALPAHTHGSAQAAPKARVTPSRESSGTAPTPPRPPAAAPPANDTMLMWMIGGVAVAIIAVAAITIVLLLQRAGALASDDVLTPVSPALNDVHRDARRGPAFATPTGEIILPSGSLVDFEPTPDANEAHPVRTNAAGEPISRVALSSEPLGATVRVGERSFTTPASFDLTYGDHAVVLTLDGYEPATIELAIDEPRTQVEQNLKRVAPVGRVEVVANGWEGAKLTIDDEPVGTVPSVLHLSAGVHTFTLAKSGESITIERRVMVEENRSVRVHLTP